MIRKLLGIILIISIVGFFIYHYFYYYDPTNGCLIKIAPTLQPSNWNTSEALHILKNSAPDKYAYLCRKVSIINKNSSCGGLDGGCFYTDTGNTLYIGGDQDNLALTVAIIVHELCHLEQYDSGRTLSEVECYGQGSEYLQRNLVRN
jgi:hypothetical protein